MSGLATLRLFNEKADKLAGLSFTESVRAGDIGFHVVVVDGVPVTTRLGPTDEAIDAFCLTLRFFVQNNEATSIANIEALYRALPVSPDVLAHVVQGRATINAVLDAPSHVIVAGNRLVTRDIFEVFLWGGLAHANPQRKATFDEWRSRPDLFVVLQMEFTDILAQLLDFIFWLANFNDVTIDLLRNGRDV